MIFILVLLIILSTGLVVGADDIDNADYRAGYNAGLAAGQKNFGSNISAYNALETHLDSDDVRYSSYSYYRDGFYDGYADGLKGELPKLAYSEVLGTTLGNIYGTRDYQEGRKSDWEKAMPSERTLSRMYDLNMETSSYRDVFFTEFRVKFYEAYLLAYEKSMLEPIRTSMQEGVRDGEELGKILGATFGNKDYYEKRGISFSRNLPSDREIIADYGLNNDTDDYKAGFLSGFKRGYQEEYNKIFRETNKNEIKNKTNSEIIPIRGGNISSYDSAFNINMEAGTYYQPVNVNIVTRYNYDLPLISNMFIKASDTYDVSITSAIQTFDDKKLIELEFEYYGDKAKGGIYKFVRDKWVYLPSTIEEGVIKTYVKPSSITGSYSVFIDTNTKIFPDARGHWAKDEINALIRRSIIFGYSDGTFKPDINISRGEFLTLLSRAYDWNMYYYTGNATAFKDYASFGARVNIINYATSMGYISGYPDGTFKPNNPISYREVEIIMSRIAYGVDSRWSTYATKMQYEKKVKSASLINMNNKITRAEVVYMLYNITQDRF